MPDDPRTLAAIDWRAAFPFTHLFRSFRVAVHPSKLLLALVALLMLYAGGRVLDAVWPAERKLTRADTAALYGGGVVPVPAIAPFDRGSRGQEGFPDVFAPSPSTLAEKVGPFVGFFNYEALQVNHLSRAVAAGDFLGPAGAVGCVARFLVAGPATAFASHPVFFSLFTLWFLVVWSVFGGAIARIAAVHVARDEKISIRQALRFSTGKLLSFLFAPLIPLMIFGLIALVIAVGGLLNYVTWGGIGQILAAAAFVLTLLVGFVMTLVLFGTVGGFSLMYPTIAVEGSDSFDAISRSFSYVYARPWRMLFYTAVAVAYGALTYLFVRLFLWTMLALVHHFEGGFLRENSAALAAWQGMWPAPRFDTLPYDVDYSSLPNGGVKLAAGILSFWVYMTIALLGAFAVSFYFSANTVIYYLMRQEVDATELDDVFLDQTDEEFLESAPVDAAAAEAAGGGSGSAGQSPAAPSPAAAGGGSYAILAPGAPPTAATPAAPVAANVGPEHVPPQVTPGPQVDNPPGDSLTYAAPSDAPTVESAAQDPQAEKKPAEGA